MLRSNSPHIQGFNICSSHKFFLKQHASQSAHRVLPTSRPYERDDDDDDEHSMEAAWSRLYPRYASVHGDEDVERLKQPLISGGESSDDDDELDEEAGLLLKNPRRDRYGDRGFLASVEPKFLRSLHTLTALAASVFLAPFTPAQTASATRAKEHAVNSASSVASIRAAVRTRRKTESMEDMTEKALGWMALLTVAGMLVLVLGVAAHAS